MPIRCEDLMSYPVMCLETVVPNREFDGSPGTGMCLRPQGHPDDHCYLAWNAMKQVWREMWFAQKQTLKRSLKQIQTAHFKSTGDLVENEEELQSYLDEFMERRRG